MKSVILLMAGGTGGHIFPALSVAERLVEQGYEIHWVGSEASMEQRLVPEAGYELHTLAVVGLRQQGLWRLVKAPITLCKALIQGLQLLRQLRPKYVIGFGGFASGPCGVAAKLLGVPLAIHEQNAIVGLTNRLLSQVANVKMQAFEGAIAGAVTVGNPVRRSLCQLPPPAQRFFARQGPVRILVLGGSLGALFINQTLPKALATFKDHQPFAIHHQCGAKHLDATQALYQQHYPHARVEAFIEDMSQAFAWADLVICRAGALTVAEIAVVGIYALFIPYPHAVDNHQTHNAKALVAVGGAEIIQQAQLKQETLAEWLRQWVDARSELLEKANKAQQLALPQAAEAVVDLCIVD